MLAKIARHTFNKIVGDADKRKAVALAIFVQERKGAGVWKGWTYRKIASFCGISPTTCKKRIATLLALGLAESYTTNGVAYLKFNKLRQGEVGTHGRRWTPRKADVDIRPIPKETIKEIERGLMALVIVEDTARKDHVRQLITLAHNPKPFTRESRVKRAMAKCRERGYSDTFVDGGLSYRTIGRRLRCSHNTTRDVIAFGESLGLFTATRRDWVLWLYAGYGQAKFALRYVREETDRPLFATKSNIWYKPSLLFSLGDACRQSI